MLQLDKVDPNFRKAADLLFFTDRTDLGIDDKFVTAFLNNEHHHPYLWDRFQRSTEIYWDESFWLNRFGVTISLSKKFVDETEAYLLSQFKRKLNHIWDGKPINDNSRIQFVAWTKVKSQRKLSTTIIKEFLLVLPYNTGANDLVKIVENFIPHIFPSMDDYITAISQKVAQSARAFQVLHQLERQGIKIDRQPLLKLASDLLSKRALNRKNRRSLFSMLDDASVMKHLKLSYDKDRHTRLLELIRECDYKEIEDYHLRNIKNLLELDPSIADELLSIYADKLYSRGTGSKRANVQRLIRACKEFPQFSSKKLLAYLSTNNKMSDIKYIVSSFPELKTLIPFI
jgi:hypothetical protein